MSKPKNTEYQAKDFMIREGGAWSSAWKIAAGVGALGVVLTAMAAFTGDTKRFAFAYLYAFCAFLLIALGGLFFVIVQRLTAANWSVTVRRTAEFLASALPVFVLLAVPVFLTFPQLCPMLDSEHTGGHHALLTVFEGQAHAQEAEGEQPAAEQPAAAAAEGAAKADTHAAAKADAHAAKPEAHGKADAHGDAAHGEHHDHDPHHVLHAELLAKKAGWFAPGFFYGRAVLYVIIWTLLGLAYFRLSVKQDSERGFALTNRAYSISPAALAAFALSLTFAMFDWVMALEPAWFSTIFGIYMFATGVCASLSVMIVLTMSLRDAGYLKDVVTVEHYHDLGKLLFGFNVFWAYVAFSQFMLIWYAGLPEETTYYHMRWDGGPWALVSIVLLFGHFVVPFVLLMSRNIKRDLPKLKVGAWIILIFHFVEWYWLVMPNLMPEHYSVHWVDFTTLLAVGGVYFAVVFYNMTKHALIPVGDPRLARSIHFQNA